jgi:hypothetical protein
MRVTLKAATMAAMALMLVFSAAASASTVPVTQLSGDFAASNTSVTMTNDGVHFGPYADAGSAGGSMYYGGANGLTLADLSALSYTVRWDSTNDSPLASPYLRIFLNADSDDVIFDPTECGAVAPGENVDHTFSVTTGDVRYDDDGCDGVPPDQQPWADVVAAHGTDVISGIYITQGFAGGAGASALVTHLGVNANDFCFVCQPPSVVNGPGPTVTPPATVIINSGASTVRQQVCKGNTVRKLHAPKRLGQTFLSVRATLRGKRLKVSGRTITADLRNQPEANYNVRLTSRYRAHSGKIVTVKTTRNISVVCS